MQHRRWGLTRLLALLLTLDHAHMYVFSPARLGAAVVQHQQILASPRVRRGRAMHMGAATPEPDEEAELASPGESAVEPDEWRSALSARIAQLRASEAEAEELSKQLAHIKHAFVLVFDVDTEEEAVYIMDVEEQRGVVLAFETKYDAEQYARSLEVLDVDGGQDGGRLDDGSAEMSVQALDLEVLVVSSREADFRVAMVFDGDLSFSTAGSDEAGVVGADGAGLNLTGDAGLLLAETGDEAAQYVTIAVTMVPEDMYAGRSSADFIDPVVDDMYVLVHDAGTADAQYFAIGLKQSECVACFKTEDVALSFCRALLASGATLPVPRAVMLGELREDVASAESGRKVCIVDSLTDLLASQGVEGIDDIDADADADALLDAFEAADGGGGHKVSSSFVITDEAGEVVGVMAADCIGADGCSVSKTPAVREMLDRLFQDDAESDGPRGGA